MEAQMLTSDMVANAPLFVNYDPVPSKYESESGFWGVTSRTKGKRVNSSTARKPWKIAIKDRTFSNRLLFFKNARDAARVASYLHDHKEVTMERPREASFSG